MTPPSDSVPLLPRRFHRLPLEERRAALARVYGNDPLEEKVTSCCPEVVELADVMVEGAVGAMAVPLGVATGFLVDGAERAIPMATEEPSVIAAASLGARMVALGGGFHTWATEPVMAAHVYLEGVAAEGERRLAQAEPEIRGRLAAYLASMLARGGGYRGMEITRLPQTGLVRVELRVDVRDAMGANVLNSAAEHVRSVLEQTAGGTALMCVLSNASRERRAGARFSLAVELLGHACPPGMGPEELARRVVSASELAREDPERAVTHNKGIMNGISALALATGNDTRAVEAGAHAWAARTGTYRGLSTYAIQAGPEGGELAAEIELPLALGSLGGSVGFHPASAFSLRVLDRPSGTDLARLAAALGLAQNLAALMALVGEGIQKGHMRLHASRLAYSAGARGPEIPLVASRLASSIAEGGSIAPERVRSIVEEVRASRAAGTEPHP